MLKILVYQNIALSCNYAFKQYLNIFIQEKGTIPNVSRKLSVITQRITIQSKTFHVCHLDIKSAGLQSNLPSCYEKRISFLHFISVQNYFRQIENTKPGLKSKVCHITFCRMSNVGVSHKSVVLSFGSNSDRTCK